MVSGWILEPRKNANGPNIHALWTTYFIYLYTIINYFEELTFLEFTIGSITVTYGKYFHIRDIYKGTQQHNLFSSCKDSEQLCVSLLIFWKFMSLTTPYPKLFGLREMCDLKESLKSFFLYSILHATLSKGQRASALILMWNTTSVFVLYHVHFLGEVEKYWRHSFFSSSRSSKRLGVIWNSDNY